MGISKRRAEMGEEKWAEYQKQRNKEKVLRWRRNAKWKLVLYKGGECETCGYDKEIPAAYDFHHRDPEEKDFGIAEKGRTYGMEKMKREVDKCDLLCCRCHMELHHKKDYSQ